MEDFFKVGIITSTHGLKGEVKVFPTTDDPTRFKKLKTVLMDTGKGRMELGIQSVRFFKNMVILKFKEFNDINQVEIYRQCELYVPRKDAVPLGEDENYAADLLDMDVYTDEGEYLGLLTDILETGANDVYVIQSEKYKEILIPAIKQCIIDVDVESAKMIVHLLPGLI